MKKILLLFFVITFKVSAIAATITNVGGFSSTITYCANSSISLTFDYSGFGSSNNFKIELSNSSGSFLSGTQYLGTVNTVTTSGVAQSISGTIPSVSGSNYKVRILEFNSLINSMSTSIAINPTPIVSTTAPYQTICSGVTTNITASNNTTGGANSFVWSRTLPSGITATGSLTNASLSETLTTTNTSATVVSYTIIPTFTYNSVSCTGSGASVSIIVNPIPSMSVTSQTICSGSSISNIYSNTTGGANDYSWTTSSVGGIIGNSSSSGNSLHQTLTSTNTSPTLVSYTVTPTFTFNSVSCTGSGASVSIIVNPLPTTPSGTISQNFTQGQTLSNLQVTGTNLIWYANQPDATNHVNPIANNTVLVNGSTYYVTQTNNGCESSPLAITVTAALGLNDYSKSEIKLYPNPTISILYLSINDGICLDKITILDITGKIVLEQTTSTNTINVEKLASGVYVIKGFSGNEQFTSKFIKE